MLVDTLIYINNTYGPWLVGICAAVWLATFFSLVIVPPYSNPKFKSLDHLAVFGYLTALLVTALLPATWINIYALLTIHLLLYTALVWCHMAYDVLNTRYGDYFLLVAALLVLFDGFFIAKGFYVQYYVWSVDLVFIGLNLSALYVSLNPADNKGRLGKANGMDNSNYNTLTKTIRD